MKLLEMFSLNPEDERKIHPYAIKVFNDWKADLLCKVPQLSKLDIDEINVDIDTYLNDDEKRRGARDLATIIGGLRECIVTGDNLSPHFYAIKAVIPMFNIKSLLEKVYERKAARAREEQKKKDEEERQQVAKANEEQRKREEKAEAERREKEEEERWRAARKAVNLPVDDAEKYLNKPGEHDKYIQAALVAIEVYMEKGEEYVDDSRTFDYRWYLKEISRRKAQEAQKAHAISEAKKYNAYLNQEISRLRSKLEPKQKDLLSYFKLNIKDSRHTHHNFNYVLSAEETKDFDSTLVSVANEKLEQLIPNDLRQFIAIPSQYYRIYIPLPSASYNFEGIPCLDFSFDIFAAAYGEVWLKPEKKSFGDYEFHLPRIEERNYSVLLQEPKLLGYYYLVLKPEELGGYTFWQTIPLVLLNWLLEGGTKPPGITISEALNDSITYKVQKFKEEVDIPDKFANYLRSIGSIDGMASMGIIIEKVAGIIKSEVGGLKVGGKASLSEEKLKRKDSKKGKALELFSEGKRPSDPEVKSLGIKPESAYRYYQQWKKADNGSNNYT